MLNLTTDCIECIIDKCRDDNSLPALCCVSKDILQIITDFCNRNKGICSCWGPRFFLNETLSNAVSLLSVVGSCSVANVEQMSRVIRAFSALTPEGRSVNCSILYLGFDYITGTPSLLINETTHPDARYMITVDLSLSDIPDISLPEKKIKFYFEFEFKNKGEPSINLSASSDYAALYKYSELHPYKVIYVNCLSGQVICNLLLRYATRVHRIVLCPNDQGVYNFFPMPVGTSPFVGLGASTDTLHIKRFTTYGAIHLTNDDKDCDYMKSPYLISSKHTMACRVRGRHRWQTENKDLSSAYNNLKEYVESNSSEVKTNQFLRVVDLRQICRKQGLPAEGKRSDLLQRLQKYVSK